MRYEPRNKYGMLNTLLTQENICKDIHCIILNREKVLESLKFLLIGDNYVKEIKSIHTIKMNL